MIFKNNEVNALYDENSILFTTALFVFDLFDRIEITRN